MSIRKLFTRENYDYKLPMLLVIYTIMPIAKTLIYIFGDEPITHRGFEPKLQQVSR